MSAALETLATGLARLELPIPTPMANTLAVSRAINATATDDVTGPLADAVAAGTIDAKTATKQVKDVATALAQREKAQEVARELAVPLMRAAARVATDCGDELIVLMRPIFDADIAILTEAVAMLGAKPDLSQVRTGGPAIGELYGRWTEATQHLAHVDRVRRQIGTLGYDPTHPLPCLEWYVPALRDTDHLDTAQDAWRAGGNRFTQLAAAGIRPQLNTAAEAAAVMEAVDAATRRQTDEAATAKQAAHEAYAAAHRDAWRNGTVAPRG